MSSLRRRQANRANSKLSTGPATRLGRLRSSRNATTHGLSRPIDPIAFGPLLNQVRDVLVSEGFDPRQAQEIALKILDYERNIALQRELHQKRLEGRLVDAIGIADHVYELQPMMAWVEEFSVERLFPEIPEYEEPLREAAKWVVKRSRERVSRQVQFARRRAPESVRYLRRASNQLIKALRRL
jgi:hypothetical protein